MCAESGNESAKDFGEFSCQIVKLSGRIAVYTVWLRSAGMALIHGTEVAGSQQDPQSR